MSNTFNRNARLEGEMRAVLAELLQHEVNDPRLAGVTVSVVRLSADRSHARIYFSVIGDDERVRQAGRRIRRGQPIHAPGARPDHAAANGSVTRVLP